MNTLLTNKTAATIIEITKTVRGCLALLHRCGGEGVKDLIGIKKCRVSLHREVQGGFLTGRSNTRHFYFVPKTKTVRRCSMRVLDYYDSLKSLFVVMASDVEKVPAYQRRYLIDILITDGKTDPFILPLLSAVVHHPECFKEKETQKAPVLRLVQKGGCL